MSGVRRASSSKRSMVSGTPARRATAIMCTTALVEPPSASTVVIALSTLAAVRMSRGLRSSHTMSTMRRPVSAAMRPCRESAAGIDAAPGNVKPSASAADVMVDAVPMVMQCPGERAMPSSISSHCLSVMLPARFSAQYFHTSEPLPNGWSRQLPLSIGPAGMKMVGQVHADRTHEHRGRRLVAAAHEHRPIGRIRAQQLLGLQRQQIAIEHRRRLLEYLGECDGRHLQRKSPRLQHAALDLFSALAEMLVARVDVAPGVDDRDDRLAEIVGARIAHLRGARMMAELPHVVRAIPAMRTEFFGLLAACGHCNPLSCASSVCAAARMAPACAAPILDNCGSIGPMSAMPASVTASCSTRIGECSSRRFSSGR